MHIDDSTVYQILSVFHRDVGYAGEPRDNCELSDRDTRELDAANPAHFDNTASDYDFYERALGRMADDCLDGKHPY